MQCNARTFTKGRDELNCIFAHARSQEARDFLTSKKIEWQFGCPRNPWANGFFERMVSVVKRPLRKILGTHCFRYRELEAVLFEIERMVNARPISAVVTDPNEPKALSPADLMYGYSSNQYLPDTKSILKQAEEAKAIVFSERWKSQQSALRGFWKQFSNEYLQYLRSIHYVRPNDSRPLAVGDVCIIQTPDPSRAYWPICVVQALVGGEGADRRQRSCVVKTGTGQILKRPIQLLYRLEVSQF